MVSTDQYHMVVLRGVSCPPIEIACFLFLFLFFFFTELSTDKFTLLVWSRAQLEMDFVAILTSLLFEVDNKFIRGSFAVIQP